MGYRSSGLVLKFLSVQACAQKGERLPRAPRWEATPACFVPGNEGEGLLENQVALCDKLVYVPQFAAATASLNVNAATAVVLSWYATAAGYVEERRSGNKYDVVDPLHALWKPKPPAGKAKPPRAGTSPRRPSK